MLAFGGAVIYDKIFNRQPKVYDFVVFDPTVLSAQEVNPKFLDTDVRNVGVDGYWSEKYGFPKTASLSWERNYLAATHFLTQKELNLSDESIRGLAFLQEMKEATKTLWRGLHPKFPYVFASDNPRVKNFARVMGSYGFVNYSDSEIKFDTNYDLDIRPEDREAFEEIKEYLSSHARTAIATSALALFQPMVQSVVKVVVPSVPEAVVSAQTLTGYSKTNDKGNENIITASAGKVTAGLDHKAMDGDDSYTGALRITTPKGNLFLFAGRDGQMEAKFHYKLRNNLETDIGTGSNGLFHTGLLYGRATPLGGGVSYRHDETSDEIRGLAWFYTDDIFLGAKYAGHALTAVATKPSKNNKPATEYYLQHNFNTKQTNHEIIFGLNPDGPYGMDALASWKINPLFDGGIFGPASTAVPNSPLRPMSYPVGWRTKNFGAHYKLAQVQKRNAHDIAAVKYFDRKNYIEVSGAKTPDSSSLSAGLGRNSDKLKYNVKAGYDLTAGRPVAVVEFSVKVP